MPSSLLHKAGSMSSELRNVLDRLSLHIDSLQDGFELLSRSGNLKDLARQFFHIVRGNLQTVGAQMFYRKPNSVEWEKLYGKGTSGLDTLPDVKTRNVLVIEQLKQRGDLKLFAAQPLIDGSLMVIFLGRKLDRKPYKDIDLISLRVFLQLFATAYQRLLQQRKEKELVFSLNHRLLQLTSLIDTGIELSKVQRETSLHGLALERAAMLTNASRGTVTVSRQRKTIERIVFPADASMRRVTPSHRMRSKFTFSDSVYSFELFEKESRAGAVPFEETDQLLLDALVRQVQASLENQHLQKQEIERQKIERDIAVAAAIQKRILPASLPAIEGYETFGTNIPTKSVGGDYYDCIPLDNGKFALVVADVSGKGVPAALLVSSMNAYLSAYLESTMTLVELAQKMNRAICNASTDDKFITAFFGILTPETGEFECLSAGHNPVYWLKNDNTVAELNAGGLALGMVDIDFPYQTDQIVIEKGERILLYTDGVTEAVNERNELYDSFMPLKDFMQTAQSPTAEHFIRDLIADIRRFCGNASQADDITAMYLRRI